jgi:hypothetical protein
MTTRQQIEQLLMDHMVEAILYNGFEDACLGIGYRINTTVLVYSGPKMIEILMNRDGMSYADAEEYVAWNYLGAWLGDTTPIILTPLEEL